jgi:hypothetical protein
MSNVLKRGQFLSLDLSQNPLGDSGAFAHEFRFSAMKYFGVPQSAAECRRGLPFRDRPSVSQARSVPVCFSKDLPCRRPSHASLRTITRRHACAYGSCKRSSEGSLRSDSMQLALTTRQHPRALPDICLSRVAFRCGAVQALRTCCPTDFTVSLASTSTGAAHSQNAWPCVALPAAGCCTHS